MSMCKVTDLRPDDQIIVYLDEELKRLQLPAAASGDGVSWRRRVCARVQLVEQHDSGGLWRMVFTVPTLVVDQDGEEEWENLSYKAERLDPRSLVELLGEHFPVCVVCGEPWPCSDVRVAGECRKLEHSMRGGVA